jgi:HD superfamily phosphohydrolase
MSRLYKALLFIFLINAALFSEQIDTFYGPIEVEEPVLLDLIKSPALQRLKHIHQYGIAYYTTHSEEYNRFDHSIGVFTILRLKGASLKEQISGILHDVSHTIFSHVGDWVFGTEYQEKDYQTLIHPIYLTTSGIEEILNKYGYSVQEIHPKRKEFTMLEQPLPNLCADRIDYNIQGAYFQGFLTKKESLALFEDLQFVNGQWIGSRKDLLAKLTRFSLFMTQDCWGSAINYATSRWLADAIIKGLETGLISWNEFHFGIDQDVWEKLKKSSDPFIQKQMSKLDHPKDYFCLVDPSEADILVKFKCRGINPWVMHEGNEVRLFSLDPYLMQEFETVKENAARGWPFKWLGGGQE